MSVHMNRTTIWTALLSLSALMSCGQQTPSESRPAAKLYNLADATYQEAGKTIAVRTTDDQRVTLDELKARGQKALTLQSTAAQNTPSKAVVFVQNLGGQYAVVSLDTKTGAEKELFRTASAIQSAAATGDGRFLAISAVNPQSNQYDVYRVLLGKGTVERLTGNTLDDLNVSITADGETIVWEAVQQAYTSSGGRSLVYFRDWGTGTGVDYYLNSSNNLRQPSISADGSVISMTEKRPDQVFTSVVSYYTQGQFFYEVGRSSTSAVQHPSASAGGHKVVWLEGTSTLKLSDVDNALTSTLASATGTLDHPHLNADGTQVAVAENEGAGFQGSVINISAGTQTVIGSTSTSNTAFAWQAGSPENLGTPGTVQAEVTGTLTAGQATRLVLPAVGGAVPELTAPADLRESVQVKFQRLTNALPAAFPADHILNSVRSTVVGSYRVLSDTAVASAAQELVLPFSNPSESTYNLVQLYAWNGERYERVGGASPSAGYVPIANYSDRIMATGYPQGMEIVAVAVNKAEYEAACTNRGGIFDGSSCDKAGDLGDVPMQPLGIDDNKLVAMELNVGNFICGGPYLVKLCNYDVEIKVKTALSARFPDLILLSEVFNNDCGGVDFTKYVSMGDGTRRRVPSGSVCDQLETSLRTKLVHAKQIQRILPEGKYTYRCSEAKPISSTDLNKNLYGGYECIALKNGFLSFRDSKTYLTPLNPACSTTTQSLSPQAVRAPSAGLDTGIYLDWVVASGYAKPFVAATAHLVDPRSDVCRAKQFDTFANWVKNNSRPPFILGGDMNTDPNRNLGFEGNLFTDEGADTYLKYFYDTYPSITRNYDPQQLTGDKLGFTLDNTAQWTAYYVGRPALFYSLDHMVTNFARPYFNQNSACERIRLDPIDLDHAGTLCPLNIQRLKF